MHTVSRYCIHTTLFRLKSQVLGKSTIDDMTIFVASTLQIRSNGLPIAVGRLHTISWFGPPVLFLMFSVRIAYVTTIW